MPKTKSIDLLHELEHQIELQMSLVTRHFQNRSAAELSYSPEPGSWSIAQCLQHLNTYGDYYLPRIEHCIIHGHKASVGSFYHPGLLGNYFVKMIDPRTAKKKLNARPRHLPQVDDPHVCVSRHLDQQEVLVGHMQSLGQIDLNRNKIPTSINPYLKLRLGDILQFLVKHNQRHLEQAGRVYGV